MNWKDNAKSVALALIIPAMLAPVFLFAAYNTRQQITQTARIESHLKTIADNLTSQTRVMEGTGPILLQMAQPPLPPPPSLEEFENVKKGRKK